MNDELLRKLEQVERLALASKVGRLVHNPYAYITSVFFRHIIYPRTKREMVRRTPLFFGRDMFVGLPASTDIYLTGGKSHNSEIRLARFIILNLKEGDHFLDIGAHYGYFSLLASEVAGPTGEIYSFEPSTKSFEILEVECPGGLGNDSCAQGRF